MIDALLKRPLVQFSEGWWKLEGLITFELNADFLAAW